MRFVFPTAIVLAVILGFSALFMHRPGRIVEQPSTQPNLQQPAPEATPQPLGSSHANADRPPPAPNGLPANALPGSDEPQAKSGIAQPSLIAATQHSHSAAAQSSPTPARQAEPQRAAGPGNAAEGRKIYRKCQACHSLQPGKQMIGPSLSGIFGRKSGAEPGFNFSPAMKQANITWDAGTLGAYLTDPQKSCRETVCPSPG
jgi:nitrite reductase (NO-forming)